MITHHLHTLPPEVTARHAREVDEIAVDCARNVLGLQHVPDASEATGSRDMRERLFMPRGGMGMMSCEKVADAAYIGHWGLVGPAVQVMHATRHKAHGRRNTAIVATGIAAGSNGAGVCPRQRRPKSSSSWATYLGI